MSQQPHLPMHGAVDLSGLSARPPAADVPGVVDVTEANFAEVIQRSAEKPVVLTLWSAADPASSSVTSLLVELAGELANQLVVGRVDVSRAPQVAQAIGSQTGATVAAVVRGQAVPLPPLDGATREQLRVLLEQVVTMAAENGVGAAEPAESAPPPRLQEANDALARGDLAAAAAEYSAALTADPRDGEARAGLARVELRQRTEAAPAPQAPAADDVDAQLAAADHEVVAGEVAAAFERLLALVRRTQGAERDRVRTRLVELFTAVGDADERVLAARRNLASALY